MSAASVVKQLPEVLQLKRRQSNDNIPLFADDLFDLFTQTRQGHMEAWSYADPAYPGDPAGGSKFWEQMVVHKDYYLPNADIAMITKALHNSAINAVLRDISTIVELGPGSLDSIRKKTIPFLSHAREYIAVDINLMHAQQASVLVHDTLGINTRVYRDDYLHLNLPKTGREKTGFVMWGSSIGNIEGLPGESPLPRLVEALKLLGDSCNPGDSLFISIDTENRRDVLMDAYNMPLASAKMLSLLHDAKRLGICEGNFTPETWTHKTVWHAKTMQCAHYLITGSEQEFTLKGQIVRIPAGRAFNIINSYKFSPDLVETAAHAAGFARVHVSNDKPIALLMATKS